MALVFMEGFDHYATVDGTGGGFTAPGTGWSLNTTTGVSLQPGRFGGQALQGPSATNASPLATRAFPATDRVTVGLAILITTGVTNIDRTQWLLDDGSTRRLALSIDRNGKLVVHTGGSIAGFITSHDTISGVLAESELSVQTGSWFYVEVRVVFDAVNGSVEVWHNGTKIIDEAGLDTGEVSVSRIRLNPRRTDSGSANTVRHDDLYITDDERIGVRRVATITPVADTEQIDFVPSSGSDNFAMVNETIVNLDTDYVEGTASGDEDRYALPDLAATLGYTPNDVDGVQVNVWARRSDSFTRHLRPVAEIGAERLVGDAVSLDETYGLVRLLLPQNPDSETTWVPGDIAGLEVGQITGDGS